MTAQSSGRGRTKVIALIAAKIALSGGLLYWLWSRLPPAGEWPQVELAVPSLVMASAAIALVQFATLALRWRMTTAVLLGDAQALPSFRRFLAVTWLSSAVGQVLPAVIGSDGLRIAALRLEGVSWSGAAMSVVIDRVIGLAGLLLLLLPVLMADPRWLLWPDVSSAALSAAGVAAAAFLALLYSVGRKEAAALLRRIPARVAAPAIQKAPLLVVLAAAGHALSVLIFVLLARAFALDVPFAAAMSVFPLALLASMLPISFGGWGVRELTVVHGLSLYGIAQQDALLASIFFGIFQLIAAIPAVAYISIWPGRIKR
ncbi:lysylphosphatidylglycerol synthase transmembrane domain-containing protein [Aestuariivirga sp.]|uniref:lysylphosphatidylglycerol synthase transmembrane domain-containing protein n=1 Tax=Aestuariivirga sp. TaxID=2650926 RepID=UPI00391CDB5E